MMDKQMDPFFMQLRRLAANVERQTEQYGHLFTENKREFSAPENMKIISDLRSDIKQHKALSQTLLDTERQDVRSLQEILTSTDTLLNSHLLKQLTETEQYLSQYGFKSYEEVHGSKKTEEQENEVKDENTNIQHHTTPNEKPPRDPNRTPRLEDAGVSQLTLQYLNSLKKHRSPTDVPVSQIPSDFLHDGIICTPSLANSMKWKSDGCDLHSALASPVVLPVYSSKLMPATEETFPNPTRHLHMNMNASPVSPMLCTPGIKQILTGKKIKEESSPGKTFVVNKRPVNVGLFQSDAKNGITEAGCKREPAVPDLTTQQYDDDEPVEPELTFSLEALSEMTGMFQINPLGKPISAVIPSTTKHIVNDNKENATPPEPEMLMDLRVLQLKSKAAPQQNTDFELRQQSYDDAPPSPKLFGTYKFYEQ